jgi:uncharacterized membrane protein YphA (DoxX/SURF4 family)
MNASVVERFEERGSADWVMSFLRLALSGVFIFAGIYKLRDPASFEVALIHWRLFPDALITPLVWGVPLGEIFAGWACLPNSGKRAGPWFLLVLTGAYTVLLIVEWARGISSDCGCFGASSAHWPYYALVLRNLGLIMIEIILIGFRFPRQFQPSDVAPVGGDHL